MVPFLASDEAAVDEKLPGGKDLVPPAGHRVQQLAISCRGSASNLKQVYVIRAAFFARR
jgi:hypothetical protein